MRNKERIPISDYGPTIIKIVGVGRAIVAPEGTVLPDEMPEKWFFVPRGISDSGEVEYEVWYSDWYDRIILYKWSLFNKKFMELPKLQTSP